MISRAQSSQAPANKLLASSLPGGQGPTGGWHSGGVAEHAPASTYVLVVGVMATFAAFGIVLIFTPPWYWFLIPAALAIPEIVILAARWARRRRIKRELAGALSEL